MLKLGQTLTSPKRKTSQTKIIHPHLNHLVSKLPTYITIWDQIKITGSKYRIVS